MRLSPPFWHAWQCSPTLQFMHPPAFSCRCGKQLLKSGLGELCCALPAELSSALTCIPGGTAHSPPSGLCMMADALLLYPGALDLLLDLLRESISPGIPDLQGASAGILFLLGLALKRDEAGTVSGEWFHPSASPSMKRDEAGTVSGEWFIPPPPLP